MARKLLAYSLLLVTILWLVASYLPENILLLPKTSLEGVISSPIQRVIFVVIMIVFVGIQISLIFSTNRLFDNRPFNQRSRDDVPFRDRLNSVDSDAAESVTKQFNLKKGPELLWTSVPVAMTLVTVLLAFTIFHN